MVNKQNISVSTYLGLYSPSIDWILQCMCDGSEEQVLVDILKRVNEHANR